nr:phospholipase/carboxylesterase family protein [uncultured bacterium]
MNGLVIFMLSGSVLQLTPGDYSRSVVVSGITRNFEVHIPVGYDAMKPHPLVLIFHGLGANPATMAEDSDLNRKADQAGFIAVYPAGSGNPAGWNAGLCCNRTATDVEFTKAILTDIAAVAKTDQTRIYAVGLSNGAMMANRLACELPDRIAAIGTVAGLKMVTTCSPGRAVPVIHFHGTKDNVIPFNGTQGRLSVKEHIAFWVRNNHADTTAKSVTLSSSAMKVTQETHRSSGTDSADVVLVRIEGGGHLWPGRPRPARFSTLEEQMLFGETTQDVSANDLIWAFLEKHH